MKTRIVKSFPFDLFARMVPQSTPGVFWIRGTGLYYRRLYAGHALALTPEALHAAAQAEVRASA